MTLWALLGTLNNFTFHDMTKENYVAGWVADVLFRGGRPPADKGVVREAVRQAIAEAEATWPEFVRQFEVMEACAAVGSDEVGGGR